MHFESDHGDPQQLRHFGYGLNPLLGFLRQAGHDPQVYLEQAGIPKEALHSLEKSISPSQEIGLTSSVYESLGLPQLGLLIGPKYHLSSYGLLGLAAQSSATLAECYRIILDNILLTWTYFKTSVYTEEKLAFLQMDPIRDLGNCMQFMIDRDLSAAWVIACEALGTRLPLSAVEFRHCPPNYAALYNELFDCPVTFGAQYNRWCFDAEWLHHPLPAAEPDTSRIFSAQCRQIAQSLQQGNSFVEHIRYFLLDASQSPPSLETVSHATNMAPRTIQRRLAAEGTNFQEVLNEVRVNLASEFLLTTSMSLDGIAEKIGYSDAAAFSNAFKRKTGSSPGKFRSHLRLSEPRTLEAPD
jgi:AraC-like DNA-binding protein